MYEVEVKVRADHDAVRTQLASLEAELIGVLVQSDTYYDHPCRSFVVTDEALRIRRERSPTARDDGTETVHLTYKGPLVDQASKSREEYETTVGDAPALEGILDGLGFAAAATVDKERERYDLGGYRVCLDDVTGLGTFVEVEAAGSAEQVESLRDGAYELCRDLDLDPTQQIQTSYLELLLEGPETAQPADDASKRE